MKLLSKHYIKTFINILILISGMGVFSSYPSKVLAQEGDLTVAPARQIIQASPGETKYFVIKFLNHSSTPISGRFGVADFIVTDKKGTPTFLDNPIYNVPFLLLAKI